MSGAKENKYTSLMYNIDGKEDEKATATATAIAIEKASVAWLDPEIIKTSPVFENLFRKDEDIIKEITLSMKNEGYREDKPVIIWKEENVLVEGHTRKISATKAKVKVAVVYRSFKSERDAVIFAFGEQYKRRNQTDGDNLYAILNSEVFTKASNQKKAIADILCVSERTAVKYLRIVKEANDVIKDKIMAGLLTVNQVYNDMDKKEQFAHQPKDQAKAAGIPSMDYGDEEDEEETDTNKSSREKLLETDTPEPKIETPVKITNTGIKPGIMRDDFVAILKNLLIKGETVISIKSVLEAVDHDDF
jgi:hypothetical protein